MEENAGEVRSADPPPNGNYSGWLYETHRTTDTRDDLTRACKNPYPSDQPAPSDNGPRKSK